jgi:hypothetical protein
VGRLVGLEPLNPFALRRRFAGFAGAARGRLVRGCVGVDGVASRRGRPEALKRRALCFRGSGDAIIQAWLMASTLSAL